MIKPEYRRCELPGRGKRVKNWRANFRSPDKFKGTFYTHASSIDAGAGSILSLPVSLQGKACLHGCISTCRIHRRQMERTGCMISGSEPTILRLASMIRILAPLKEIPAPKTNIFAPKNLVFAQLLGNNSSWIRIQTSLFRQIVLAKREARTKRVYVRLSRKLPDKNFGSSGRADWCSCRSRGTPRSARGVGVHMQHPPRIFRADTYLPRQGRTHRRQAETEKKRSYELRVTSYEKIQDRRLVTCNL